ncbi:hypothetical protein SAMN02745751_00370 [Dethiosulfatibacter aminovorans DSM 17477]|uniref:Uncharacterized protein n=1 Tax=Dethiosulfatibacter aminovorans DSM 17477 TaxID=1121476 RepID=A0A1M6BIQ8_9FIRM|nr:hypothetical protein [Dethiosulfatibacter aminovorans]SHI48595.1 hypothetical protein SAMN02745751_00370 [Dethiosulfatibacter aminovorans DSM 17477]
MVDNTKNVDDVLKIDWIGLDGFLVLLYACIVATIMYGIMIRSDFIIGKLAPYGLMTAVTLIFASYLFQVASFIRVNKK